MAKTAGYTLSESVVQNLDHPDPRRYLGKGKADFAKRLLEAFDLETVITRHELSPSQLFNLEKLLGVRIIDRTQLILKIFQDHATTKEGKLEVELASLKYDLPRLKGLGRMLSQTGGGIGTRGPGEQKLEMDRRQTQERINRLKGELKELKRQREVTRKRRYNSSLPLVSFVGYTNVGKSSLVSGISERELLVQDKLFATLDTKVSRTRLPSGMKILVSDTVGFIRELPHELMESFRSTLEEVKYSDLLVVVSDASALAMGQKCETVRQTLNEIGAGEVESIHVINKIDRCTNERLRELETLFPGAILLSAKENYNIDTLLSAIEKVLSRERTRRTVKLSPEEFSNFMKFRDSLEVLSQKYGEGTIEIEYLSSDETHEKLISSIGEEGRK